MRGTYLIAAVIVAGVASSARAQPSGSGSGAGSGSSEENELPPELAPKPHVDEPNPNTNPDAPPTNDNNTTTNNTPPPPPPDDPKAKAEARKLIDGGDQFIKKGDYLEKKGKHDQALEMYQRALAAYEKAYDLVANAQIYFAIAGAEEKLGHWLDAANHYKKMLAEAADMKPALKDAATQRLEAAKAYLGQITLTVTPDGTHVSVEGKDIGTSPLTEPLILEPGEYTLGFTHDGYTPTEQKIKLEAGSESERTFTLQPIPVVVEKPRPPPPPPAPPPTISKTPLYVGAGITAAFGVTALVTGIVAVKKHGTYVDDSLDPMTREAARTSGKHFALACDLTMVGALAAGGYTAWWYLKKYKPKMHELESEPPPSDGAPDASLWLAPMISDDAGGMIMGGRF
ncbi:MAG TPA: PEGA domain-containing protein [Kofleriaceae bacterium]|nr:PEGA domain-containing protein [Kofleriaceae bacterium]